MGSKAKRNPFEETPTEMMKRVFAVAELVVRSESYQQLAAEIADSSQKHGSDDLLYRRHKQDGSGIADGTQET